MKKEILSRINKSCGILFQDSIFLIKSQGLNKFLLSGNNLSKAINVNKSSKDEIKVLHWFDDFWVYLQIEEKSNETNNINTFISVSIFQGDREDIYKYQLFRAEWDDYNNIKERHPQPHWHITSEQGLDDTIEDLKELSDESSSFMSLIEEERSSIIDIKKMHFAMNGNWCNDGTHVNQINSDETLIKWFQGLFSHIKIELEYVKKKEKNSI